MTKALQNGPVHGVPESLRRGSKLEIVALFTTEQVAIPALRSAANLASGLSATIRLLVPHVVPHALTLAKPAIDPLFISHRLCAIAAPAGVGQTPGWWSFAERYFIARMARLGHQIVFAERERNDA